MNKNLVFLQEPEILFGYGQKTLDPRDGLTLFGPYDPFGQYSIQAGVIGTEYGVGLYQQFVTQLQRPLYSKTSQRPTYPGFEAIFGIEWSPEPAIVRLLNDTVIKKLIEIKDLHTRTEKLVNLYVNEIKRVHLQEETKIDVWYLIVPKIVWWYCRPKSANESEKGVKELVSEYRKGQGFLFADMEAEAEAASQLMDTKADFHDQLKARLLQEKIYVPVQIALEPTLRFRDKYRNWQYKDEMKAHLAWTVSSTLYYKLGRLPWKLSAIREGVCYLGLVFKKYNRFQKHGFACSAAQMFLDSGDGTVFKGNVGPWESKSSKEFHLDQPSAKELLAKALLSYKDKHGKFPKEVFIHGRASFTDEEWSGFTEAISDQKANTELIGVVIKVSDKLKLFRDVVGEDCKYGNLRGLASIVGDKESFLWTTGFVPRLNTSLSQEIPNTLRIQIDRGQADISQVLRDVLALTKLNYNACIYGDGTPVTLRFSDNVGRILTAVDSFPDEVLPFKYYI